MVENSRKGLEFRIADPKADINAVLGLFRKAGWVSGFKKELFADDSRSKEIVAAFLEDSYAYLACYDGIVESVAQTHQGTIQQTDTILPLCAVTAVICGYVLRKQKATSIALARVLADRAKAGDAFAMLGIFDQGFYDRLGFGTNPYEYEFYIDPRDLNVPKISRPPKEFSLDDFKAIYRSRCRAHSMHGVCTISSEAMVKGEMIFHDEKNGFVLGYTNEEGEITHHLFANFEDEHGPGGIHWLVFQNEQQLLELLQIVKSLSDQIYSFWLLQPPQIRLQDYLHEPFRSTELTKGGKLPAKTEAYGFSQLRVLDIAQAVAATHFSGETVSLNIQIDDPIERFLENDSAWRGVGGEYVLHLGEESSISPGRHPNYESISLSVNDFSRMLHGSISPAQLCFMQKMKASEGLLKKLTRVFNLPEPHPQWLF